MKKKRKNGMEKAMFNQYLILVIPGLIIFTIGLIIPMIMAFRYSLTSWDGMSAQKTFVGFQNYINLFKDAEFKSAWIFTIEFTLWNTVIQNVLALLFAIALDSGLKGQKIYRTAFFLPCLISSVVVGFIWLRMFTNVLPEINNMLGTKIDFGVFGDSNTVLGGLLVANNWQWIGYWMLIYLAGLQSIPTELYEAAKVDGANPIKRFFNVTIPMLAPSITICIVGITTGSLKVYDLMVSSTHGGPGHSSTSIIYKIYNTAIGGRQYGYGSAMSITMIVVLLLVAIIQVQGLRKREVQA